MKQMEQISIRKCQLLNLRTQMRRFETYKIDPLQIQISPSPPRMNNPNTIIFVKADYWGVWVANRMGLSQKLKIKLMAQPFAMQFCTFRQNKRKKGL